MSASMARPGRVPTRSCPGRCGRPLSPPPTPPCGRGRSCTPRPSARTGRSRRGEGMGLHDLGARLVAAGEEFAGAAATLPRLDPGAGAFGADAVGHLGGLGRELYRGYLAALDARIREAAAHGARLSATGDAVMQA